MVKKFFKSVCILAIAEILLTTTALAATGTVTGERVRIRKEADSKSIEVSLAKKGEKVEVIGDEGNWYHVKFENVTGYISKDYVSTDYSSSTPNTTTTPEPEPKPEPEPEVKPEEPEQPPESQEGNAQVEEPAGEVQTPTESKEYEENQTITFEKTANLRYLPNFTSRIEANIEAGATYTVIASLNNWIKISNDNNCGWVLKNSIDGTLTEPEKTVEPEEPQSEVQPEETQPETQSPEVTERKGKVNVDSAVIRKSPNGEKIDSLPNGTEVTILGEENDWYNIKTSDYESCYIAKRLIKES